MIVLAHGEGAIDAPLDWHVFTTYPAAATAAQACRLPTASRHWITDLAPGASQWQSVAPVACVRPPGVVLIKCDTWATPNDWRAKARFEAGLLQVCADWRAAGTPVVLTMATLGRRFQMLRAYCDALVPVTNRFAIEEWWRHADVQPE